VAKIREKVRKGLSWANPLPIRPFSATFFIFEKRAKTKSKGYNPFNVRTSILHILACENGQKRQKHKVYIFPFFCPFFRNGTKM
jgi:hypothetical protein